MKRSVFLMGAALSLLAIPALRSATADEFQTHIDRAIAKTREMDKVIDGIAARQKSGGTSERTARGGPSVETMKCGACGMEMTTRRANNRQRAVKIKGKTFYCCAGCDMSKIVDK